jgi:predicted ATP-dependent endonuclease of OLD family
MSSSGALATPHLLLFEDPEAWLFAQLLASRIHWEFPGNRSSAMYLFLSMHPSPPSNPSVVITDLSPA